MRPRTPLMAFAVVVALAGCASPGPVVAPSSPTPPVTPVAPTSLGPASPTPVLTVSPTPVLTVSPTPVASVVPASRVPAAAGCHFRGPLPDPACTPGALNPVVTQASIHQTICVSGYTTTIRPPVSESTRLKHLAATAYSVTDSISNYEGDHLISLELGGAPDDIANFWDERRSEFPGSTQKDELENYLNKAVCSGRVALVEAQQSIATNWTAAYCAARLPRCTDGTNFR